MVESFLHNYTICIDEMSKISNCFKLICTVFDEISANIVNTLFGQDFLSCFP